MKYFWYFKELISYVHLNGGAEEKSGRLIAERLPSFSSTLYQNNYTISFSINRRPIQEDHGGLIYVFITVPALMALCFFLVIIYCFRNRKYLNFKVQPSFWKSPLILLFWYLNQMKIFFIYVFLGVNLSKPRKRCRHAFKLFDVLTLHVKM